MGLSLKLPSVVIDTPTRKNVYGIVNWKKLISVHNFLVVYITLIKLMGGAGHVSMDFNGSVLIVVNVLWCLLLGSRWA